MAHTRASRLRKPQDDPPSFDDRLRRISVALFAAGMAVVVLVANTELVRVGYPVARGALNWVAVAGGASTLGVLLFPWRRRDRNLFVLASVGGLGLVGAAVYFSGGWESPFFPLYFFVAVFAAIYYSPRVAAAVVLLTVLVSLSPQLYDPDATRLAEHAMVFFPSCLALALVSGYMAREIGKRERLAGERARELGEARELSEHFRREAGTDRLTGLPNRHRFEAELVEEIARARRRDEAFTVIFLDLDDFKRINDAHGHRAGDEVLKVVAEALRLHVREDDALARHGGDEFTVLLSGTPPEARRFFLRIREEVARLSEQKLGFRIALSAGTASYPHAAEGPAGLLEAADFAMYEAKRRGKGGLYHRVLDAG